MGRPIKDRTGKRYGMLVALRLSDKRSTCGNVFWECRCDCGETSMVTSNNLQSGTTRSCGCRMGCSLPPGEAARNQVMSRYRQGAIKRGLEFDLSVKEFIKLTSSDCYYCGEPPKQKKNLGPRTGSYTYNGIDRKDNDRGYVSYNCIPCCWGCNQLKGTLHYVDFIERVMKITNNQKEKGVI